MCQDEQLDAEDTLELDTSSEDEEASKEAGYDPYNTAEFTALLSKRWAPPYAA